MSNKAGEIILESRKKLVEKIIKNIEKGDLIFNKNWDSQMMMPQNPVSKANYLGGNRIRLIAETIDKGYKDPRWVTFKQAESNGWNIRKGEKGTLCEKWIFSKVEKSVDENGKTIEKEIKLDKPIPNYFYVFNAEQVENIPKLEINNYTKNETNEIIENFISNSECKIKEIAQSKAYYNPRTDEIVLPSREAFKSQEDFLATTFHEMVHSTGHKDRLDRDLTGIYGSDSYAREELVAELGAVFLQSKLGIKLEGEHFDNHSAYLKSWIEILKNDPNELFRAAVQAEKAEERLYQRYAKYKELNNEKVVENGKFEINKISEKEDKLLNTPKEYEKKNKTKIPKKKKEKEEKER
ncbi:ArdC family protein [Fusobacterium gastrosuis]|uniref:ArdC family protein n=1 Tax=Fusobacterium gastrosuis TaxID=1755100 RepID=UPI00297A04A3|nr:zincin-like metallopeptidase domain-containing protein [Fusobacteriaceae bacterium]MDY5714093.1 zincin-like metallopeptidase domain-containing protein [Fusobacterium gastrosuis]